MKNFIYYVSLAILLTLASCASQKSGSSASTSKNQGNQQSATTVNMEENVGLTLAAYLRRIPGLQVTGDGPDARIMVRGMSGNNERPLYVLDGRRIGNDFSSVSSLIDPNDIKSVQVLKDAGSTTVYGIQGSGGVIKITSKKK
jgi:TonB-dependent SusC/RagA subfamily outer membrane receptor